MSHTISVPSQRLLFRSVRVELLALSLLVGCGAGGGAVGFRYLIQGFTQVFTGYSDYSAHAGTANPHLPVLGRFFVVLAPMVAGILYGPVVYRFAREARGHGVPEVMVAVARNGGRIRPQVAVVKALASALCIGGGGSVGREGPIVQIGSALGSSVAQLCRLDERRIRLLVACGAAGGIAATFNAPLAGVFFAMELILRQWEAESFGMVVLSSVTSSVIGRAALGNTPFIHLPAFSVDHVVQYPLFALLGLVAGLGGVAFSRILYAVEDACDAIWRGPEWARPAVGGVVLGGLLLVLPEMYGVGYPVLDKAVDGGYAAAFLLALLAGKMLACSLTIGIGGSGGVFAPSLFCGAMVGAMFGDVVRSVMPGSGGSLGAYALVGMGAVFAGAARAPITAVVIMFELTGEYSIILPLMLAIALATGVSNLVSRDTVYTRKLLRRGVDIEEPADATLRRLPVSRFMVAPPTAVPATASPAEVAGYFASSGEPSLPVVDADDVCVALVTASEVARALLAGEVTNVLALGEPAGSVAASAPVGEALRRLDAGAAAVPVADENGRMVGWLRHRDVLAGWSGLRPTPVAPPPPTARVVPAWRKDVLLQRARAHR